MSQRGFVQRVLQHGVSRLESAKSFRVGVMFSWERKMLYGQASLLSLPSIDICYRISMFGGS